MSKKLISLFLSFNLLLVQSGFAQGVAELNLGQYLGQMGASLKPERFRPPHLRYFSYDIANDNFQLLLDKGDNQDIKEAELEDKTKILLEYFQIGLALPNDKFWVNLRPDAQDQIIDPELEKTDLGKVMLEADLQLKKDTAQFTSPQSPEGRLYWDKLYQKARELFGSEPANIPTITRPWIVPGEIIVREGETSAYIFKANMKVMLEEDYLSSQPSAISSQQYNFKDSRMKELNTYSTQLIRELIIPKLTKEVNTTKRYAALRQVFFSLVMARWFKERFASQRTENREQRTEHVSLVRLIDSRDLTNLISKEPWSKSFYFNEYKKSFEKGEYNLKEQIATPTGQVIRSYVSGGNDFTGKANSPFILNRFSGEEGFLDLEFLGNLLRKIIGFIWVGGNIKDRMEKELQFQKDMKGFFRLEFPDYVQPDRPKYPELDLNRLAQNIAAKLHEAWKEDFAAKQGKEAKRWKPSKDENWKNKVTAKLGLIPGKEIGNVHMTSEGKVEIDIAHTDYNDLPPDWQAENKAAGEDGANQIQAALSARIFLDDLSKALDKAFQELQANRALNENFAQDNGFILKAGDDIHKSWLERNGGWALAEQKPPFIKLDANNQKLVLNILKVAIKEALKLSGSLPLATDEMKKKLKNLKTYLPGENEIIWQFGEFLSGRLNPEILPAGFNFAARLALYDLQKGIDGFTGKPIENLLVGYPSVIYNLISLKIPTIIEAVAPKWFAEAVKKSLSDIIIEEDNGSTLKDPLGGGGEELPGKASADSPFTKGGIDLRTMQMLIQPMGSFSNLNLSLPTLSLSALERIDLDQELDALRNMVKAGLVPSGVRVKEYLAAVFQKGKMEEKQDDLLVCLAEIYRLQEEEVLETSPELRESLVIVDTGRFVLLPNNQRAGLN